MLNKNENESCWIVGISLVQLQLVITIHFYSLNVGRFWIIKGKFDREYIATIWRNVRAHKPSKMYFSVSYPDSAVWGTDLP